MNSTRRWLLFLLLCFMLFRPSFLFGADARGETTELEEVLGRLRAIRDGQKPAGEPNFVGQGGPFFEVKELRISGNSLISTAELLADLPLVYRPSEPGKTTDEAYDFRVLYDTILEPGQTRKAPHTTIPAFTRYLVEVYRRRGYAGIYVYVPENTVVQERLVDQVLSIKVLEGRVSRIQIQRFDFNREEHEEEYLRSSVLESWSPVKPGDVIRKDRLDDFIRLLNLNPDRYVSAVISSTAEPNSLGLGYDVYESNPWHWYLQVDDAGTKDRQWAPRLGLVHTNVMGIDDKFSVMYQAPWEKGIEDEYAVFGSYDFPILTPRLRLNVYAGYSQFDITTDVGPGVNFLGNGSFFGGILSYNVLQISDWFVDLTGSVSRERSKVTPSLGQASDVDMDLWGVGVNIHRADPNSSSSVVFNRVESMGGSSRSEFELARMDADPDFSIFYFSAMHSLYLDPKRVNRLSGSFRYIHPDARVVPAKMTTFGGLYSVRGYEEDEIVADGGVIASLQYEFDLVKHSEKAAAGEESAGGKNDKKPWLRKLAPLVFMDLGRARIESPVAGEKAMQELCSVGVGTIFELEADFSGAFYCGWALRETEETDRGDCQLNLSLLKRF
ncbi:MAG: ShlB/FhaC/HecB family hemolysin secretion/activation protein [Phycisphaerales bacterium]|nr:MAG: ShlB/FhaC/HecB family hemolysin secretion/activation protein [Phycisphaerales bacterium]